SLDAAARGEGDAVADDDRVLERRRDSVTRHGVLRAQRLAQGEAEGGPRRDGDFDRLRRRRFGGHAARALLGDRLGVARRALALGRRGAVGGRRRGRRRLALRFVGRRRGLLGQLPFGRLLARAGEER